MPKFMDITNQRFGRLVAKQYMGKDKNNQSLWLCKCDCIENNEIITNIHYLTSGDTKSCGCLKKEQLIERNKKYNTYDLSGEYGIGYLNNNEEFYFDLEDYNKIKNYYWQISTNGYIYNRTSEEYILLHRLILNLSIEELTGDHIDLNRKNNRKYNLRICSMQENSFNRGLYKNNTSGVTGVFWDGRIDKWTAQIKYNYKNIILGYYDDFNEAVEVRKQAEEEYFGKYSYDNSQKYIKQILKKT